MMKLVKLRIILAIAALGILGMANANAQIAVRADTGIEFPDKSDKYIEVIMPDTNVRHKRYDLSADVGIGFKIIDRYSIVLGYDYSFVNKYEKRVTDSRLTASSLYLGFRCRLTR